jgi:phage-related protein
MDSFCDCLGRGSSKQQYYFFFNDRLSKYDIERVLLQPFSSLSRKEAKVRKLLSKYHDNAEAMKRSVMLNLSGFNPNLAESVRIKMLKAMSSEEKEWMSLDKVLNPEVWSYYSNEELLYKKDGSDEVSALDVSKAATTRRPDKNSSSETAKNRKNTESM